MAKSIEAMRLVEVCVEEESPAAVVVQLPDGGKLEIGEERQLFLAVQLLRALESGRQKC